MPKFNFKKHKKIWSKLAMFWEKFTEPGRPSRDDIRNYNRLLIKELKNKRDPEVLVLGSTPEIRDLLFKFSLLQGAAITCADMTREMYEGMSELIDNKNKKERFVPANWVDMKFDRKFDIIIGDYVNPNISTGYKDQYYKNILFLLKNDGCFITKDAEVNKDCMVRSIESLFNEYVLKIKSEEITIKQAASWMGLRLVWASWFKNEKKDNKTSLHFFWPEIEIFSKKLASNSNENDNFLLKIIYAKLIETWKPFRNKYWTFYPKKENQAMLKRYFAIKEALYSNDYDKILTKASPVYLLKKCDQ